MYAHESLSGMVYTKHQTAKTTGIPEKEKATVIREGSLETAEFELRFYETMGRIPLGSGEQENCKRKSRHAGSEVGAGEESKAFCSR